MPQLQIVVLLQCFSSCPCSVGDPFVDTLILAGTVYWHDTCDRCVATVLRLVWSMVLIMRCSGKEAGALQALSRVTLGHVPHVLLGPYCTPSFTVFLTKLAARSSTLYMWVAMHVLAMTSIAGGVYHSTVRLFHLDCEPVRCMPCSIDDSRNCAGQDMVLPCPGVLRTWS